LQEAVVVLLLEVVVLEAKAEAARGVLEPAAQEPPIAAEEAEAAIAAEEEQAVLESFLSRMSLCMQI
jgi:hypothetical protein